MYSLLLAVDKVLARHSPVMVIQRWVRGWLVRKTLDRSSNPRIRCVCVRVWCVHVCVCVCVCVYVCVYARGRYTTKSSDCRYKQRYLHTTNTHTTTSVLYCGLACLQISCEEEQCSCHTTGSCAPEELPQAWWSNNRFSQTVHFGPTNTSS